jgi:hypothetical protein
MGRKTKAEEEKLKKMDEIAAKLKAEEALAPELAFTMRHVPGKPWEFVTYTIKNGKIIDTHIKECMDKDHAIESYKIEFVTKLIEGK